MEKFEEEAIAAVERVFSVNWEEVEDKAQFSGFISNYISNSFKMEQQNQQPVNKRKGGTKENKTTKKPKKDREEHAKFYETWTTPENVSKLKRPFLKSSAVQFFAEMETKEATNCLIPSAAGGTSWVMSKPLAASIKKWCTDTFELKDFPATLNKDDFWYFVLMKDPSLLKPAFRLRHIKLDYVDKILDFVMSLVVKWPKERVSVLCQCLHDLNGTEIPSNTYEFANIIHSYYISTDRKLSEEYTPEIWEEIQKEFNTQKLEEVDCPGLIKEKYDSLIQKYKSFEEFITEHFWIVFKNAWTVRVDLNIEPEALIKLGSRRSQKFALYPMEQPGFLQSDPLIWKLMEQVDAKNKQKNSGMENE